MPTAPDSKQRESFEAFVRKELRLAPNCVQLAAPLSPVEAAVRDRLDELKDSVYAPVQVFEMVWNHLLTPRERQRLAGGDRGKALEAYRYAPILLVCSRPIWFSIAILETAKVTEQLLDVEYRSLRRILAAADPVASFLAKESSALGITEREVYPELEDAIRDRRLVVVNTQWARAIYWNGNRVSLPSTRSTAAWAFFVKLVESHLRDDHYELIKFKLVDSHNIANWKNRLSRWMPRDLYQCIKADRVASGYKIVGLPSTQIKLLDDLGNFSATNLPE